MSQPDEKPKGDPWHALGYVVSGVAFYGLLGWLADRWLGTNFLVAVGIVVGAALGIYLTLARFQPFKSEDTEQDQQDE
jgi:F0F1-type ATP synthase assembly protein I